MVEWWWLIVAAAGGFALGIAVVLVICAFIGGAMADERAGMRDAETP